MFHSEPEPEPDDGLVLVSGVRCKSQPTLEDEEKQLASKAHMAVLCCHLHKKTGLSLKVFSLQAWVSVSAFMIPTPRPRHIDKGSWFHELKL